MKEQSGILSKEAEIENEDKIWGDMNMQQNWVTNCAEIPLTLRFGWNKQYNTTKVFFIGKYGYFRLQN